MEAIVTALDNSGDGDDCEMLATAELTISACAWRVGVFIANEPMFRARIPPEEQQTSVGSSSDPRNTPDADFCTKTLAVYCEPERLRDAWFGCRIVRKAISMVKEAGGGG
jgi:hypothetical protein